MTNIKNKITIWHQPNNFPILGTIKDIKNELNSIKIEYELSESPLKNHTAFSVDKKNYKIARDHIEKKYGRKYLWNANGVKIK